MRTLTLRLNEKDIELKRLISLTKERGETVSQYISLALQSYLFNGRYVCIATVDPKSDDTVRTTSYTIPEPVFEKMEELTLPFGKRKKANFVKTVLLNSIQCSSGGKESLANLYDLVRDINSERVVLFSSEPDIKPKQVVARTEQPGPAPVAEETLQENTEVVETSTPKEPEKPVGFNHLLGGLFPDLGAQMSGWDM